MRRGYRLIYLGVAVVGALAGVAIAGRPEAASDRIVPVTSTTAAPESTTTAASTTSTTTKPPDTSIDAPAAVIDHDAAVVIANAARKNGLATTVADTLTAKGWNDLRPATAIDPVETTRILAADGFEDTALQLAADLQLDVTIEPLGSDVFTTEDVTGDVVVLLGTDVTP